MFVHIRLQSVKLAHGWTDELFSRRPESVEKRTLRITIESLCSMSRRDAHAMFTMSMSITHLGTGSRGNATLLETEGAKVLIDQGFSGAQLQKRLNRLGIEPTEIDCIFISHHHGDHGGGACIAQKRWGLHILANERTAQELGLDPKLTS